MSASLTAPGLAPAADAPKTLSDLLLQRVQDHPQTRFIEIDHAGEHRAITAEALHLRALGILHRLRERAVPASSDVVLCFERALDFVPAVWACIYGGYSCLLWQLPKHPSDKDIRAKLQACAERLERPVLIATAEIVDRLAGLKPAPFQTTLAADDPASAGGAAVPLGGTAPADGAFLIMTSGSMGAPKVAILSHRSLLSRFLSRTVPLPGKSRVFCFPFDSVTGMWFLFPAPSDNVFVQPERLAARPLELLSSVAALNVSTLSLSNAMAARLLEAIRKERPQVDLASLETLGFGGEMIAPHLVLELAGALRDLGADKLTVAFGYGMTETGPLCGTLPMSIDQLADRLRDRPADPASVGACAPGWSLRIVDESGHPAAAGGDGDIEVWSATKFFSGYRKDPELTKESFTADGWFKTGDVGKVEDGALQITGRRKSIIIINARKIALESIEAPLRQLQGIRNALVAALPVRGKASATDELAIVFVCDDDASPDDVARRILRAVSGQRLSVKHLLPVEEPVFPLTATGKIRRDELARLYRSGTLKAHERLPSAARDGGLSQTQSWLAPLWRSVLKLDFTPGLDEDFFDLGGDSFASAELIFAVEEKFTCSLPVEAFFERPTIATMAALVERHAKAASPAAPSVAANDRLLHRIQSHVGGWKGQRLFEDSLVVGFNTAGRRPPIFWVFQSHKEAAALAKRLGPDQPLYAMRSCVGIVRIRDYTTEVVETVCNRYLWELLALRRSEDFIIGGNCQGGILALAMARRLRQMGLSPLRLVLLEWSFAYGAYDGATLLIYADASTTAKLYTEPEGQKIDWQRDFPHSTAAPIPGRHGSLFSDKASLSNLVRLLSETSRPQAEARPRTMTAGWPRLRLWQ